MQLGRSALNLLLMTNAVELRFRRRNKKAGFKDFRRMLCTNDRSLLSSALAQKVLGFQRPTAGRLKYNPSKENLVITWDIFMQNWRMINCDEVEAISVIKTSPDPADFWKYFNERLMRMSAAQKARFMNT